jgi:Ca2+-binding RTX toxin-like protein
MATITGRPRNEVLTGTSANDIIDGKGGSDLMRDTYNSNDTYVFNVGYGQPNITDYGGFDTIKFGEGIKASDIKFYLTRGGYLMPRIKDTTDKPEISFWPQTRFQIERWVFSDGTVLTNSQISRMIDYSTRVVIGTGGWDNLKFGGTKNLIYLMQGDDILNVASSGNNIIEPSKGNDKVYSKGGGNDEIYASPGTDYIEDWYGNERYIYNKGDGQDVILDKRGNDIVKFGRGFVKSDLTFAKSGNDLVVRFRNSSYDRLIIKNWVQSSSNKIETFELWDGSRVYSSEIDRKIGIASTTAAKTLSAAENISQLSFMKSAVAASENIAATITGTNSYDRITSGNAGDDVYNLQKGNDRIMDYTGNDTYLFNKGDGKDNIGDDKGSDTIAFGSGISMDNISFVKENLDLIIKLNGTEDSVNVNKWFRSANNQIEKINFEDGSYLTSSDVNQIVQQIASYSSKAETEVYSTDASSNQQDLTLVTV